MDEELIFFRSGTIKLEGLLQTKPGDKGVVITHPHPLYGGSIDGIAGSGTLDGISAFQEASGDILLQIKHPQGRASLTGRLER